MLHRVHGADRGASLTEYATVILLVAALAATVLTAGVPGRFDGMITSAMCEVAAQDTDACADPSTGTRHTRADTTGDVPRDWRVPLDDLRPAPRKKADDDRRSGIGGMWRPPEDQEWFEFEDRGDYNWDCGAIFDVACKMAGGVTQGVRDLWDGAASAACLAHLCSHSGFRSTWGDAGRLFTQSPITSARQMWKGFTQPIKENWQKGGPGKTLFYGLPAALGGALKPFKLLRKGAEIEERENRRREERRTSPGTEIRADLREARRAAERGDTEAANRAIKAAEERIAEERRKANEAGCTIAAPSRRGGALTPLAASSWVSPRTVRHVADGCDDARRLEKELGVAGDRELDDIVKREKQRSSFFSTRKGRAVAKRLTELDDLEDETLRLADKGDAKAAGKRARQAELLADDLRRRADKEKDPKRRRALSDAADTAEARLLRVQDHARTAGVLDRIGDLPASDRPPDNRSRPENLGELWRRSKLVIDDEGRGAPYVDTRNPDPTTGRDVLRIDRTRYNSESEIAAAVAETLVLENHGYNRQAPNGLRGIVDLRHDDYHQTDELRYVKRSVEINTKAYHAAVRTLRADDVDPNHVSDPVLRDVYRSALRRAEELEDDEDMYDGNGNKHKGETLEQLRDENLRTGVHDAMYDPNDGLGGQSPAQAFADEYATAMRDAPAD